MLPFISHKFQRQNVERAKLALLTDKLAGSSDTNESDRQSDHIVMMVAYKKWEKILNEVSQYSISGKWVKKILNKAV